MPKHVIHDTSVSHWIFKNIKNCIWQTIIYLNSQVRTINYKYTFWTRNFALCISQHSSNAVRTRGECCLYFYTWNSMMTDLESFLLRIMFPLVPFFCTVFKVYFPRLEIIKTSSVFSTSPFAIWKYIFVCISVLYFHPVYIKHSLLIRSLSGLYTQSSSLLCRDLYLIEHILRYNT